MVVTDVAQVPARRRVGRRARTTPTRCPGVAVASAATAPELTGTPRRWRVVGASTDGWWCTGDDTVLVFTVDRAVRLPNSVVVAIDGARSAAAVAPDDLVVVGNGLVACRSHRWRVVRWWDPRVASVAAEPADVVERIGLTASAVRLDGLEPLVAALRARDPWRSTAEARRLLGRGEGLTPEMDDLVTGAVAGYRHVGASIGDASVATLLERARPAVLAHAAQATTLLSTSLLRHAFDGDVAAPVGALLRALTGRGELTAALRATCAIGHSSGPALAAGVVAGAASAVGVWP